MNATVPLAPVHDASCVAKLLGIDYTAEQIAGFGPPPETLDGFVTFFDPGLSILALRAAVKERGRVLYPQSWYNNEPFAKVEDGPRYRQVRMHPVPNSTRLTFDEQIVLVPDGEEVPTARVVVTAVVIHFLATGKRLLPNVYVRCASHTLRGYRVDVGFFGADGLLVSVDWRDNRYDSVGLASSRKFQ